MLLAPFYTFLCVTNAPAEVPQEELPVLLPYGACSPSGFYTILFCLTYFQSFIDSTATWERENDREHARVVVS